MYFFFKLKNKLYIFSLLHPKYLIYTSGWWESWFIWEYFVCSPSLGSNASTSGKKRRGSMRRPTVNYEVFDWEMYRYHSENASQRQKQANIDSHPYVYYSRQNLFNFFFFFALFYSYLSLLFYFSFVLTFACFISFSWPFF